MRHGASSLRPTDMARVVLTGWVPGLRKVSLAKLLQQEAGLPPATAKDCVDRCLARERVTIEMPSAASASRLVVAANALGALSEVEGAQHRRTGRRAPAEPARARERA